jgi:hypothetical protein
MAHGGARRVPCRSVGLFGWFHGWPRTGYAGVVLRLDTGYRVEHLIGKILVPPMVRREARKEMPANMAALKKWVEAS